MAIHYGVIITLYPYGILYHLIEFKSFNNMSQKPKKYKSKKIAREDDEKAPTTEHIEETPGNVESSESYDEEAPMVSNIGKKESAVSIINTENESVEKVHIPAQSTVKVTTQGYVSGIRRLTKRVGKDDTKNDHPQHEASGKKDPCCSCCVIL